MTDLTAATALYISPVSSVSIAVNAIRSTLIPSAGSTRLCQRFMAAAAAAARPCAHAHSQMREFEKATFCVQPATPFKTHAPPNTATAACSTSS